MTARLRLSRRDLVKLGLGIAAEVAATPVLAQGRGPSIYGFGAYNAGSDDSELTEQHNPVLFWNDISLRLVALDHSIDAMQSRAPGPCTSARALGLVHIVMADAVAAAYAADFDGFYVPRGVPVGDHPEAFVGGAAASILEYIFDAPAHAQLIASARRRFLDGLELGAVASWQAGLGFARSAAFTSRWDGNALRRLVTPTRTARPAGARGHEVDPFNPDQGFYGVHWGRVTPLDPWLRNVAGYGPPPPPAATDAQYWRDFEEVRQLGAYRPGRPTEEQVRIGLFWSYDGARLIGPPPRLYNQMVLAIAQDDAMSVIELARLLALCNVAMADASIVCWEAKYRYDLWRPVVAIRQALQFRYADWRPFGSPRTNPVQFARAQDIQARRTAQSFMGAGDQSMRGQHGQTLDYSLAAFTPNFPAYPSGHAMLGSACFTVLKRVRAERARTHLDPNRVSPAIKFVSDELNGVSIDNFTNRPRPYVPLSYTSIDHMIADNNRSRVHLGVHWHFDCERGAEAGALVAERVYGDAYQRRPTYRPDVGAPQRPFRSSSRR